MTSNEVDMLIDKVARQMRWSFINEDDCVTTLYPWLDAITEVANTLVSHCGIDNIRAVKYAIIAICSATHIQIEQIIKVDTHE